MYERENIFVEYGFIYLFFFKTDKFPSGAFSIHNFKVNVPSAAHVVSPTCGVSFSILHFLKLEECAGVEGSGNWNSGPGVVDVSVISADRAVSPIRVDCQCPRKVSQVCNRGESFPPLSDRFPFSARLCSSTVLTVGVQSVSREERRLTVL